MMQENPLRGVGLALIESYFSGLTSVLDSGPRLSNPLDQGVLNPWQRDGNSTNKELTESLGGETTNGTARLTEGEHQKT